MESPDLNPPSPSPSQDELIEAWLRQPRDPLADDGFSARVVRALPSRRQRAVPKRAVACGLGLIAGTVLATVKLVSASDMPVAGQQWNQRAEEISAALTMLAAPEANLGLWLAAIATTVSILYALRVRPLHR